MPVIKPDGQAFGASVNHRSGDGDGLMLEIPFDDLPLFVGFLKNLGKPNGLIDGLCTEEANPRHCLIETAAGVDHGACQIGEVLGGKGLRFSAYLTQSLPARSAEPIDLRQSALDKQAVVSAPPHVDAVSNHAKSEDVNHARELGGCVGQPSAANELVAGRRHGQPSGVAAGDSLVRETAVFPGWVDDGVS